MRILHCVSSLSGGGAERQLSYLAPALAERGVETHVAYLAEGPCPPLWQDKGIEGHALAYRNNYDLRIVVRLVRLMRRIRPDVVQSWSIQMDVFAGIAAIISDIPWVLREANCEDAAAGRGRNQKLRLLVARGSTHVVANSQSGRDYWRVQHPDLGCSIIENGLPGNVYSRQDEIKCTAKRKRDILYAGRLVPHKNVEVLLLAMDEVRKHYAEARLLICGAGCHEKEIVAAVDHLDLGENVMFMGHVNQRKLRSLMCDAAYLVNPSLYEGCPNVVLEAMACGCPVVVSDIQAHRDILNDASACFFDARDAACLAEKMLYAFENPLVMGQHAMVAYDKSLDFSVDAMVERYLDLYKDLNVSGRWRI